ncbi:MAG TPA: ATP-binding protein [Isosphaeraceae bacterium]|nr:ATP-binding protein [Isosphaeraceae bacterium]
MAWHRVPSSPDAADLDEVLITNELSRRPARSPDYEAENRALVGLARAMVDSPQSILPRLVETALDLCNAQTAGISLLESSDAGEEIFRWHALAGAYAANLGGTTPRGFSPCGIVLDRHTPQLFSNPALHFAYLAEAFPLIAECLLIPFFVGDKPVGTVWVMTDDEGRKFDAEDERILTSLGEFAAAALHVVSSLDSAHQQIAERRRAEEALEARVRQQAAVAELGQRALAGIDLGTLMDEATVLVTQNLAVEYSNILELLSDGATLLLRAGTGWGEGLVGRATLSAEGGSPAGYTLLVREPVIIDDLRSDARFGGASLLRDHGVVSGLSVVILGQRRPYGTLGAYTARNRRFTRDDVYFLQAAANMLAMAIERRQHEQEQRERDLLRADQMVAVGQMAAGVAHELRNPLTAIKGLVQINLKEARSCGLPTEDLCVIEQEIRRMERTLQTFLDFARPPRPERRHLSLAPLIERTLALIRGRVEKQKVALRLVQPTTRIQVEGDGDQLQQLLLNLALNALDVMPRGGSLEVEIRPSHQGQVEIRISDTGPGIAPPLLPYVFEPFVSGKESGLGLGLAVSRRIAEDHGGSLEASNRPAGGACFVLRLPALPG